MGKKRKRPIKDGQARKTLKMSTQTTALITGVPGEHASQHSHPVISIYYRQVLTLRQYLLQRIPATSKSRRRRIASVPSYDSTNASRSAGQAEGLSYLLDTTLVGVLQVPDNVRSQELRRELAGFTASKDRSLLISSDTGPPCPQAEVR
ncbi:hypothetical protein BDV28DRAFT_98826 [Aspergillus coremiiformis]|uniref:Uncharacterized protein n=1 Tax=Aspergillus coremiiformis TaxID=138285 RepID=A0A5N6Z8D0_9EURO|nr:hypothetical protein BDV28DRAFT_98826 [Aspergillus coremiiformis]